MQDVTEQSQTQAALEESNRRLEETLTELRSTQAQAVRQGRLQALGTMASGVAHDFNNALGPILGYSDILLTYPETLDDKRRTTDYLRIINTSAKDAAAVVNRLKEFYRHREDSEVLQPVDLNQTIGEALSLTQPRWKDMAQAKGGAINLLTELHSDLPLIAGGESNLRTVLTNLVLNAVDAMPKGGTLTISTKPHDEWVRIDVSDTGTGMTEDVMTRAFEPFFTTKGEDGTGLGLAMVFGTVERHGGKIDIQSEPGRGSTFSLFLPVLETSAKVDQLPDRQKPPRSLHVLVADDESVMQHLLGDYLERDGHTVTVAADGQEALQKFRSGEFDLVITDRGMPVLGGDDLAAAISAASDVPVIMVTGFGGMMVAAGERPPGVSFTLSKPVAISALRDAISSVLPEWESKLEEPDD